MLSAISRARMSCRCSRLSRLSQSMADRAGTDQDAKVRAQKCLEVATLFEAYERLLTARQLLDFGDWRCRFVLSRAAPR